MTDPSDGPDTIVGTAGPDVLEGLGGGDLIDGRAGDDTLRGGLADDTLIGGTGRNVLSGGPGDDTYLVSSGELSSRTLFIYEEEGEGRDTVVSAVSLDLSAIFDGEEWFDTEIEVVTLIGGADLTVTGNIHDSEITGNAGNNVLRGGGGADTIDGGAGIDRWAPWGARAVTVDLRAGTAVDGVGDRDVLISIENAEGRSGDDRLSGDDGPNRLVGLFGDDTVAGRGGDDTLFGGEGSDSLLGGAGNDELQGRDGADTLEGGDGEDLLEGGAGIDRLSGGNGSDTLLGGEGDDVLRGGQDGNLLRGDEGDLLRGEGGDDVLDGGRGDDTLEGGAGVNIVSGHRGDDLYLVSSKEDRIVEVEGSGDDTVISSASVDLTPDFCSYFGDQDSCDPTDPVVDGFSFLYLPPGNAFFFTRSSEIEHVTLTGRANVRVDGNGYATNIIGNAGNNLLIGGGGGDTLTGGGGADTFAFQQGDLDGPVTLITDFGGRDRIALDDRMFGLGGEGIDPRGVTRDQMRLALEQGRAEYDTGSGALSVDIDGEGGAAPVQLLIVQGGGRIEAEDLLLF